MQPFLRCSDFKLARWLTSNPVRNSVGAVTVVCGAVALIWPLVPRDAGEKMEAA